MKYKLLQLFPIFILSACATTKTTNILFSPVKVPPDSAIVYVYNPHAEENAYILKFFVNGKEKFDLPDNSYGYVNLQPGEHILRFHVAGTNATPGEANISVSAGKEYYVRAEPTTPDFSGVSGSIFDLVLVSDALSNIEIDIRLVEKVAAGFEIYQTTLALGVPDLGVAISASSPAEQAINSDHVVNLVPPTPEAGAAESISAVESISGANIDPDSELDLRALVSGATRSGVSSKGWRFHVYAAPDGQMFVRTETNKKKVLNATGTWEINQSNQLCENFNDIPQGYCLTVTPLGGNRYMTQATEPSSRIEVAFNEGDTQGLDTRPANALSSVGNAALPKSGENCADSDSELHALICNATWWGKTRKGVNFIVYAAPDGELFGRSTNRYSVETWDTGLWDANKSGQLCRRWDRLFKPRIWGCMDVRPLGGNRYLMRDEDDTKGIEVVIVKGDPKGLDTRDK